MKIKALLLIIILAVLTTYVNAEEGSRHYVITKGDTLWDISDSELNEPMLWPRLWHVNPQIPNPDLIYPNQVIRLPIYSPEIVRMPIKAKDETAALRKAPPTKTPDTAQTLALKRGFKDIFNQMGEAV